MTPLMAGSCFADVRIEVNQHVCLGRHIWQHPITSKAFLSLPLFYWQNAVILITRLGTSLGMSGTVKLYPYRSLLFLCWAAQLNGECNVCLQSDLTQTQRA